MRDYDLSLDGWFNKNTPPLVDWFDRDEPATSGGNDYTASLTESASAADAVSVVGAFLAAISEAATAGDVVSYQGTGPVPLPHALHFHVTVGSLKSF